MKPRYYIGTNSPDGFQFYGVPRSIATLAESLKRRLEARQRDSNEPCAFVLKVQQTDTGPVLEFVHADRFLDAVADGSITDENSWQRDEPVEDKEIFFCWRELTTIPGEDKPRLIVPHANPDEYEQPMDYLFDSAEEAIRHIENVYGDDELELEKARSWKLCISTVTPVPLPRPIRSEEE